MATQASYRTLLPFADSTYDLGSASLRWANIYADNVDTATFTLSGMTQGSVLFAGASGLISQDNANFKYTDATNLLYLGGDLNFSATTGINTATYLKMTDKDNGVGGILTMNYAPETKNSTVTWLNDSGGAATKDIRLALGGVTAQRTYTFPDLSGTFALTGVNHNVSFGTLGASGLATLNGGVSIQKDGTSLIFVASDGATNGFNVNTAAGAVELTNQSLNITGSLNNSAISVINDSAQNVFNLDTHNGNLTFAGAGTFTATNIIDNGLTASKVVFTSATKQLTSTGIGTSAQFIKGDGSLDSSTYYKSGSTATLANLTISGLTASRGVYTSAAKLLTSTPPTSGVLGYWSRAGTTISTATAGDNITTTGDILANEFNIDATIDHEIYDSSDDLVIKNLNADKDIIFSVNDGGTQRSLLTLDSSNGASTFNGGSRAYALASPVINALGNPTSIDIVGALMAFTLTNDAPSGYAYAMYNSLYQTTIPTSGGIRAIYNTVGGSAAIGSGTINLTSFETDMNPLDITNGGTLVSKGNYVDMGGAIHISGNATWISYGSHLKRSTGGFSIDGTVSNTAYGLYLEGWSTGMTQFGGTVTNTLAAIYSNGGDWQMKHDSSTGLLKFGAGLKATIGYDGTNLVIDPKLVGSGVLSVLGDISILDEDIILGTTTGTKIGTATSQKLSFFNSTPIIQQTTTSQTPATFVANTSGIADDTATWNGYTIGDLVAIMQAFGLIA